MLDQDNVMTARRSDGGAEGTLPRKGIRSDDERSSRHACEGMHRQEAEHHTVGEPNDPDAAPRRPLRFAGSAAKALLDKAYIDTAWLHERSCLRSECDNSTISAT